MPGRHRQEYAVEDYAYRLYRLLGVTSTGCRRRRDALEMSARDQC